MNIPYIFKKCTKCGEWLVANIYNFNKAKKGKWGLESQCKKCRKKYREEYYENNKEKEKKRSKKWREDNEERYKEYHKEHYESNKEHYKEYRENNKEHKKKYDKKYREENEEKIKRNKKQYYEENKEEILEKSKKYRKENPQVQFNGHHKRKQKEQNQGNGITKEQWFECYEFFNWECAYSGIQLTKENRNLDHVIALNNGGEHEIWNCVPMYDKYNISKHANNMLEWYLQQEYFDVDRLTKIYEWRIYAYWKWGK